MRFIATTSPPDRTGQHPFTLHSLEGICLHFNSGTKAE